MSTAAFVAPYRDNPAKFGRAKSGGGTIQLSIPGEGTAFLTTGAILAANRDFYAPWRTETPLVVDQLVSEITTSAGTNFRIGFYAADTDWQPVGPPLADSGNLSSASTGVKTYTPGTPIYVPRGRYVSVINCDNTPSLRVSRASVLAGFDPALSTPGVVAFMYVNRTYAAFATPGTAWTTTTLLTTPTNHWVFYRVSAA